MKIGLAACLAAAIWIAGPAPSQAADDTVTFTTVNWPPYYGENLPGGGPLVRVTRQAFQTQGYAIDVTFTNWERGISRVEAGKTDFQLGAWITEDRKKRFAFTDVIARTKDVFIAGPGVGVTSYDKLSDLKDFRIGVGRGWDFGEKLQKADSLNLIKVPNTDTMVRMLRHDRIDMMIETQAVGLTAIEKADSISIDDVHVVEPALRKGPLAHAISLQHPERKELLNAFNKGLKKLRETGRLQELMSPERFNLAGGDGA